MSAALSKRRQPDRKHWGVDSAIGTLAPGKQAKILAVDCNEKIQSSDDILEYLTTVGESIQVDWLE